MKDNAFLRSPCGGQAGGGRKFSDYEHFDHTERWTGVPSRTGRSPCCAAGTSFVG